MTYRIAIDGPAGSGKSTVAKQLAFRLGFTHLDTGAMYRAVTLFCLNEGIDLEDEDAVVGACARMDLHLFPDRIVLNGEEVTQAIRSDRVSAEVSLVSSYGGVREQLVERQREMAAHQNAILDGRDIGTVVLPDADLKIFLTASPEVRAKRRMKDEKNTSERSYEDILEAIKARDAFDSQREIAPLRPAQDALWLDTSEMTLEEVVNRILEEFEHVHPLG